MFRCAQQQIYHFTSFISTSQKEKTFLEQQRGSNRRRSLSRACLLCCGCTLFLTYEVCTPRSVEPILFRHAFLVHLQVALSIEHHVRHRTQDLPQRALAA